MDILVKNEELLTNALIDEAKKWFLNPQMLGALSTANPTSIVLLWVFVLVQTSPTMRLYQLKHLFKIY